MLKRIRNIGTVLLCCILLLGFVGLLTVSVSWLARERGSSAPVVQFFSRNAAPDLSWLSILTGNEGKYARRRTPVEKYEDVVRGIETTIENLCTTSVPGSSVLKSLADGYRRSVMRSSLSFETAGKTNHELAMEAFSAVQVFSEWLSSERIPFLYVQFPFGTRIRAVSEGTPYPADELDAWDRFSGLMEESDVEFLNFNDDTGLISRISLDDTGHWSSEDAIRAAAEIAGLLNRDYGFHFDLSVFEIANYRDILKEHPDLVHRIRDDFGYDYELMIPVQSADYEVIRNEADSVSGDFVDTLLYPVSAWDTRVADGQPGAYHNTFFFRNGDLTDIHNFSGTDNPGKRILVLGDSFCWPLVAYLSQDVDEITLLHPRYFQGDVRTYIESIQPDIVLWMYVEAQVSVFNSETFGIVNIGR